MIAPKRPPGGWPWEQPGYSFSIGWPPEYAPQKIDTGPSAFDRSLQAASNRQRQIANGFTGTILMNNRDRGLQRKDSDKALVAMPPAPSQKKGKPRA